MEHVKISDDPTVQAHYERCLAEGTSDSLARIFALHKPPGAMTDREFLRGQGTLADQFPNDRNNQLAAVVAGAKRHGYTPGIYDVYEPGLADFVGDPKAFVPPDSPRSYIKRVCERENLECRGMVKHKAVQRDPAPETGPPIAQDIIDEEVNRQIAADPGLAPKRKTLEAEFCERHAPKPQSPRSTTAG